MKKELARILDSTTIRIKRVEKVREYFRQHPEEEKFYQEVYELSTEQLKRDKSTSQILKKTKASKSIFTREFAVACIAARQPLMTPADYVRELTGKTKKENGRISPSIGRYSSGNGGYTKGKYVPEGH